MKLNWKYITAYITSLPSRNKACPTRLCDTSFYFIYLYWITTMRPTGVTPTSR